MKKIYSLLALGLLGATLAVAPVESKASTVDVVSNSSSGIANANWTATLDDGTVLGFYNLYSDMFCFCGAISNKSEINVPDSISISSTQYPVKFVGYSQCDFSSAKSVVSLILPQTITEIYSLPTTVKELHVNNYISSSYLYSQVTSLEKILVPEEALNSYFDDYGWSNYVLINAEGSLPLKVNIKMTKAGEFAQSILQQVDNWYKVNELTVSGDLNSDDLNVFKRMRQLTKLDLSQANITNIPSQFDGASSYYNYRDGFNLLEELILPEINSIGDYAFSQCYRLKSITIPKVNKIGYGAFANCGVTHISLPEELSDLGGFAFYQSQLESITIPSSITQITEYCFSECDSLRTVTISASVKSIDNFSFYKTPVTSISLPGVTTIGEYAFAECKQLSEIHLSEGLLSISNESFAGCTALSKIELPSTLLSVQNSFTNCNNIKTVISRAVIPPTHYDSYYFILSNCDMTDVKLYVPGMSVDNYRKENGWNSFYTILPLEERTSNAFIYQDLTIDDASQFASDCDLTLGWEYQTRNGYTQNYFGSLDVNGSSTLSMKNYHQSHFVGYGEYYDNYSDNSIYTSLISNSTMRADNVQTTLGLYSKYYWYFISFPYDVKVSEISYPDGTQFAIRKYSGLNRAQQSGNTWVNLTEDSIMHAYEGYILKCSKDNAEFTFPALNNTNKNKVFEKDNVVMPIEEYISEFEHNRSWNLIGNPYPCYYDTRFMNFIAPITVWNKYDSRYDAYSPVDDSYILHPAQSFFIQRPVDQATITFDKAGRQKNATVKDLQANAKRRAVTNSHRKIFNVLMSNGIVEDRTRFVVNSNASLAYELDKDASKFIAGDNAAMLVYTVEDGVKYAINERPMADGIINLGFYSPTDGDFTLSLNTAEEESLVLIDHETNTETALPGKYHFTAKAGYDDSRFTIMFGETTGISTINIDNGSISANSPYAVYTIDGRFVGNYNAGSTANLSKGIYVVNSMDVKRKIVVK